ncbi:MAG: tetratricopeptide repeat protein, partial [Polyangiales bacterium]
MSTDGAQPPEAPPTPSAGATSNEAVEVRIAALRAEIEAEEDKTRQAVLHYEVGHLLETRARNDAMAVREYLTAYNLDASFRPPLFALVRIFERRRSFKNLSRLHRAEARSAQSEQERASAAVDQGVLLEDHVGQPDEARQEYRHALETHPGDLPAALMLERHARGAGDPDAARYALETLAHHTGGPVMKGLLLGELALDREQSGDVDGAIDALEQAVTLPLARYRLVDMLERLARRHQRTDELIKALEAKAALASAIARGEDHGQASGTFAVQRFADPDEARREAVALWQEAARRRLAGGDAQGARAGLERALEV